MTEKQDDKDKVRFSLKIGESGWVWVLFWLVIVYMMVYGDPLFWLR